MKAKRYSIEEKIRLFSSHKILGNDREPVDEAFPGDVIGLVGHDSFGLGDTRTTDLRIADKEIPRFTPGSSRGGSHSCPKPPLAPPRRLEPQAEPGRRRSRRSGRTCHR